MWFHGKLWNRVWQSPAYSRGQWVPVPLEQLRYNLCWTRPMSATTHHLPTLLKLSRPFSERTETSLLTWFYFFSFGSKMAQWSEGENFNSSVLVININPKCMFAFLFAFVLALFIPAWLFSFWFQLIPVQIFIIRLKWETCGGEESCRGSLLKPSHLHMISI